MNQTNVYDKATSPMNEIFPPAFNPNLSSLRQQPCRHRKKEILIVCFIQLRPAFCSLTNSKLIPIPDYKVRRLTGGLCKVSLGNKVHH